MSIRRPHPISGPKPPHVVSHVGGPDDLFHFGVRTSASGILTDIAHKLGTSPLTPILPESRKVGVHAPTDQHQHQHHPQGTAVPHPMPIHHPIFTGILTSEVSNDLGGRSSVGSILAGIHHQGPQAMHDVLFTKLPVYAAHHPQLHGLKQLYEFTGRPPHTH